jgi:hypothetical protein
MTRSSNGSVIETPLECTQALEVRWEAGLER